jgi:hypothetical protein
MAQIEYLYDDVAAAKSFVLSLKLKVIRERFSSLQDWNPDNCVLAMVGGRPVALADCNRTEDGLGAICGLISRPGFGGYAVCALSALKRHMHGIPVPQKLMRKFMIPSAPRDFQHSVDKALSLLDDSGPSLFSPQKMDMRIARGSL